MRKKSLLRLIPIFAGVGVLIFFYIRYRVPPQLDLTSIPLETLSGKPAEIRLNKDERLCIKFFATWCIDCRRELPDLIGDAAALKKEKIRLVLVSDEAPEQLQFFIERDSIPFEMLHLKSSFKSAGIYTLPTTYWYNESGALIKRNTGKSNIIEGFK
ncbi:MAG: TlpA disulfide reductase family protein [Bacteroidia bacterium]|jgi:thiol-disulfide isomerase/thioredoxin